MSAPDTTQTAEPVGLNHIQVAGRILDQIAASGGEDAQAALTLMRWRDSVGIGAGALEAEAMRSAKETVEEIAGEIEKGMVLDFDRMTDYLAREYMAAFQVGYIVKARQAERAAERAEREAS